MRSPVDETSSEKAALAKALQELDYSTWGVGNPWMHQAAQLLRSDWMAEHDRALSARVTSPGVGRNDGGAR